MQRILIIGSPGAGKSTLARTMGERLGLNVVHLDQLWWRPGWVEAPLDEFRAAVMDAAAGERWVMDGNFSKSFDIRAARADTIIWIDQPRLLCLWRAVKRVLTHRGAVRADMAEGCPVKIDMEFARYIWTYPSEVAPRMEKLIDAHGDHARFFRLRSDAEMNEFVERL